MSSNGKAAASIALILWHELGHLVAILLTSGRISLVELKLGGIEIGCRRSKSRTRRLIVLSAGIVFNISALFLLRIIRADDAVRAANLMLLFFNLLPVGNLDGGQIAALLLESFLPLPKACRFERILSLAGGALIAAAGVVAFAYAGSVTVAMFALYVLAAGIQDYF